MTDKPFKVEQIDGQPLEVYLNTEGMFMARLSHDDQWIEAGSYKALIDKMRKAVRTSNLRLSIPMTLLITGEENWRRPKRGVPAAEPITLTGMHGRTGKALITRANGEKETYDSFDGMLTRRVTDDEGALWVKVVSELHQATDALEALKQVLRVPSVTDHVRAYLAQQNKSTVDVPEIEE